MYFQNICSGVEYFTVSGIVVGTLGDVSHLNYYAAPFYGLMNISVFTQTETIYCPFLPGFV